MNRLIYVVLPYRSWWFGRLQWAQYMCNNSGKSLVDVYDTEDEAQASCDIMNGAR